MKVIDKTPFQTEKGTFDPLKRFQAVLEYGAAWPDEVEAQKSVIAQLEKVLEKGYTLIRNLNLENSKIIEPLILVGPPGMFVLYVTAVTGFYEAKGDAWSVVHNNRRTPAKVNLLIRVARLARAVQIYLNRQGVYLPGIVEPILIAASPAVHIESARPIVRVVLSDAVKQYAASLVQARALLTPESAREVVDHLINPRKKAPSLQPEKVEIPVYEVNPPTMPVSTAVAAAADAGATPGEAPQRARAIFHAAEETKPFDPADLSFEFDEHGTAEMPEGQAVAKASRPPAVRTAGLTARQWLSLVVMLIVEFLVLAGFIYLILFASP
jgi:hypothetical protein